MESGEDDLTENTDTERFKEILARLDVIRREGSVDPTTVTRALPPQIPLIDPTANVLSLVAAAIARQDDLRGAEAKRIDDLRQMQFKWESEIQKVRDKAQGDLMAAEAKRIDSANLAESRRLDALLAAATSNVQLAAEKAGAAAATLAAQVSSSAETLRTQVAATAATTNTLITQVRESLEKRLTAVEQNQYQGVGVSLQRTEGRQRNEWVIGLAVLVGLGVLGAFVGAAQVIVHFMK